MKNKKGLIGKLLLILFVIVLIIAGITAYQIFDLIKTIEAQQTEIQSEISQLQNGDCSKISTIETRTVILESKAMSTCANPIIYYFSKNYGDLPYDCDDLSLLKSQVEQGLTAAKNSCDIKTLNNFTEAKIQEYLKNLTSSNYQEYASKFNVNISNQSEEKAIQTVKDYLASQTNVSP